MNAIEIKKLRNDFSLTQEDLAEILGVSRATIINYEGGGVIPAPRVKMLNDLREKMSKGEEYLTIKAIKSPNFNVEIMDLYKEQIRLFKEREQNLLQRIDDLETKNRILENKLKGI